MSPKSVKTSSVQKSSIRLALTAEMREAFERLKQTRYSFLKEDEILKLAFSKLYALEYIPLTMQTSVDVILTKIREKQPEFGKDWIQKHNIEEREMGLELFCQMVIELMKNNK